MSFHHVIADVVKETLSIAHEASFFSQEPQKRLSQIDSVASETYPVALRTYLSTVSVESFVHDLREAVRVVASGAISKDLPPNGFWKACAYGLAEQIDRYDTPELIDDLQRFVRHVSDLRLAFVQTPVALDAKERSALRAHIQKESPNVIPLLSVEPSLGGGLRLFKEGTLFDLSWTGTATTLLDHLFAH